MSKYIDADAFLKKIEKYSLSKGSTLGKHSGVADEIIDVLMNEPTADVVEVVRCKDCEYYLDIEGFVCNGKNAKFCFWHNALTFADDYCSKGERKEG